MATSVNQGSTGSAYIDGLLGGTKWSGAFTFSFPLQTTDYQAGNDEADVASGFAPVTFQQREATRAIMTGETLTATGNVMLATSATSFIGVTVSEAGRLGNGLNGSGDIRLGESTDANPTAYAYYPNNNSNGSGGDVWFGTDLIGTADDYRNPVMGSYAYHTHIHEIGHAMGLKHSHELDGVSNVAVPANRDAIEWTVMSYRSYVGASVDGGYEYGAWDAPQTFMIYDIQALQTMYGANYGAGANNTNTVYTWSATTGQTFINGVSQGTPGGNKIFMTVWDGGGIDAYDMSNFGGGVSVDLNPGSLSITSDAQRAQLGGGNQAQGNVYNSLLFGGNFASIIENAIGGAGNDTITGNQVANVLTGNGGNDTLYGGAGGDALSGGSGFDFARYDNYAGAGMTIRLDAPGANTGEAAGDTFDSIEGIIASFGNDAVVGDGNTNYLYGLTGNDYIYSQGGNDYLSGDDGNDNLWGAQGADQHVGGSGFDLVRYDDYTWGDLVIRLDSPGSNTGIAAGDTYFSIEGVIGGSANDVVVGDGNVNYLYGLAGNDYIYGQGGNDYVSGDDGSDNMWGGAGADQLAGGSGFDLARYDDYTWGNLTIRLDTSIYNTGAAMGDIYLSVEGVVGGAGNDFIVGDAGGNYLYGLAGNDYLYGQGGFDYMVGGAGSDIFVFSTAPSAANNVDTIADFAHASDRIMLLTSIFSAIGATLDASELALGAAAADANDYLIYNNANGQLFYDADGSGTSGQTLFATLTPGTVLDVNDFIIV